MKINTKPTAKRIIDNLSDCTNGIEVTFDDDSVKLYRGLYHFEYSNPKGQQLLSLMRNALLAIVPDEDSVELFIVTNSDETILIEFLLEVHENQQIGSIGWFKPSTLTNRVNLTCPCALVHSTGTSSVEPGTSSPRTP